MAGIEDFLRYLQEQFRGLEISLTRILKEEKTLHDDVLIKKGFIIHSYSLNYGAINLDVLSEIGVQLESVLRRETQVYNDMEKHAKELDEIEMDYAAVAKKRLHTDLLMKYLKEALYYCGLMITRINQLKAMLQDGMKFHKKSLPKETEMFFASFENGGTKILKFLRFLEQLLELIVHFEKEAYYPEPRMYGRAMVLREYDKTIANKKLSSSKDPTPVFDAPRPVIAKITSMSKDQMKTFFGQIGVVGRIQVLFFATRLKPVNYDNPIPQSNGLREYKFPKGVGIEIVSAV